MSIYDKIFEYDNFKNILKNENKENFMCIDGLLPYPLEVSNKLFSFELNIDINGNYGNKASRRKIIFMSKQVILKNQAMPAIKGVIGYNVYTKQYTNRISLFNICIELSDGEVNYLYNGETKENIYNKIKKIYQIVLLFISIKYNQSLLGNDCINLTIEDCGAAILHLFVKDGNAYKPKMTNVISRFSVNREIKHKQIELETMFNQKDLVWLYFFNKTMYSFDRQDYLNTILYCAISLESYLIYLIDINNLNLKYEKYNNQLKTDTRIPGFFTTCKFLKDNNLIDANLKKIMEKCYGELSCQRNDIVHGNIKDILLDKRISEKCLNELNNIYCLCENSLIN